MGIQITTGGRPVCWMMVCVGLAEYGRCGDRMQIFVRKGGRWRLPLRIARVCRLSARVGGDWEVEKETVGPVEQGGSRSGSRGMGMALWVWVCLAFMYIKLAGPGLGKCIFVKRGRFWVMRWVGVYV